MTENSPIVNIPPNDAPLRHPWLVAIWPGMGGVAAIAGGHLIQSLGALPAGLIPERDYFSIDHVDVRGGIARAGALPRSMFFAWRDPKGERDLLVFIGEAQPPTGGFSLCHRIMDVAVEHGVERVVTFAAMGTSIHPSNEPKVFGAVTVPELLEPMREAGVERLQDGQVSGLNGSLLAAAADRGIPAMCLLGEMPLFAAGVPNPKSALGVLHSFERLFGIELNLQALESHAKAMEPQFLQLLSQLRQQVAGAVQQEENEEHEDGQPQEHETDVAPAPPKMEHAKRKLGTDDRQRIEALFAEASDDRTKAERLKDELDRLDVFAEYEDRFLDLFRRTE
ncbi:MAG: PAC2 family protein [Phycisphaerales bacterium]|nr:PAC2 family protein [Phycisphaerales bacterium]